MTITDTRDLAEALAAAPTGIYQREMLSSVTLHDDGAGNRTVCELSVRHSPTAKAILANLRIVGQHDRDGYTVTTWHPTETERNRRLRVTALSRYSDKALERAHEQMVEDLLAEPNQWLHSLSIDPITEED